MALVWVGETSGVERRETTLLPPYVAYLFFASFGIFAVHLRYSDYLSCQQVYEILTRTVYGKRKHAEIGIDRLLNERVYSAAFPLHEVAGLEDPRFVGSSRSVLMMGLGLCLCPIYESWWW